MSWKLDDIDFKEFGVYVSKSMGVLDLPEIVDTSIDWFDANGRDYWQAIEHVKYSDKDVVLHCFLRAGAYPDFKAKTAAFFAALTGPGKRILLTPYGNTVEVSLQDEVVVTSPNAYFETLQTGVFTLRLTVSGDPKVKYIDVQNDGWPGIGWPPLVTPTSDIKLTQSLQAIPEITFTTEVNEVKSHGRSNYIIYAGEKYVSFEHPAVEKLSSNKLRYRLTFRHQFYFLHDIQFRVIDRSDTPWQSTVDDIITKIIENMERAQPGLFVKGTIAVTESRNNMFSNESCFEVLTRIAQEYELEWEYKTLVSGSVQINVKKTIDSESGLTFQYGKNNELYKVTRAVNPRENICTRLYAYGSAKNIPASYGYPRLKLATEPMLFEHWDMKIERTKVFEDIFPNRTGAVTSYLKKTKAPTWVYAPGTEGMVPRLKSYTFYPDDNTYEMTDTSMDFDLKEKDVNGDTLYLMNGTTAKIHFNSGDLAGFEFEVLDYDHLTKTFKLIPYRDEQDTVYPTAVLYPKPGNAYKILDINIPQSYITAAETALFNAASAWLIETMTKDATYEVETVPASVYTTLTPGQKVTLIDLDFAITKVLRVAQVTTNLMNFVSNITLASWLNQPKIKALVDKVSKIEAQLEKAKTNDVDSVRANETTTGEVVNKLLDPIDNKLKVDRRVRRKSLDPVMLSPDASTIQYSIRRGTVESGVDSNPNKIRINPGVLLSHNFYAVSREDIKLIKSIEL